MQTFWLALWWPQQQQNLLSWVRSLSRWTPQIYVWSSQALLLEVGRSRSLIGAEALSIKIIEMFNDGSFICDGEERLDWLAPQIGSAADPAEALAKAQYAVGQKRDLPMGSLIYFLEPYKQPLEFSRPLKKMMMELQILGVTQLGAFMDFSEREVGMRWSHWGKHLWMRVHGFVSVVEPQIQINEVFVETYDFPEESSGTLLEPLYFISKQLLQKLQKRLQSQQLGARSLRVTLVGSTYETDFTGAIEFDLALPAFHHEVSLWLGLLRERLQSLAQQQKLPALLESMELRVHETISWHGLQKDLLDPQREQREGALLESLTKIETRLGEKKVFYAEASQSYRPEKSWRRGVASEWFRQATRQKNNSETVNSASAVYDIVSQKPLKVFGEALPVTFRDKQILYNNQWENYRLLWCEIICGEFWSEPFERRYGVAYLEGGERLWVYKEGEQIYLQGHFL